MVKNYELEHFKNIKEEKFKKDNENFLIFLLKKLLKSVKHKLSLFTTTIKKACAMCQFTNKFTLSPKKNNMHNLPTLDNIDNDFWENETTTSLEESVK